MTDKEADAFMEGFEGGWSSWADCRDMVKEAYARGFNLGRKFAKAEQEEFELHREITESRR